MIESSVSDQTNSRFLEIDYLRGVAVLAVLFYHLDFGIAKFGFLGVDLFFFISGFLIFRILYFQCDTKLSATIIFFLERRFRRIIPAYIVFILLSLSACFFMGSGALFRQAASDSLASLIFVSNFVYFKEIDYFGATAALKPFVHTWSLSVEEQFYLASAIILLPAAAKFKNRRVFFNFIFVFFSFISICFYLNSSDDMERHYLTHFHIYKLCLGGALGVNFYSLRSFLSDIPARFSVTVKAASFLMLVSLFFFELEGRSTLFLSLLLFASCALYLLMPDSTLAARPFGSTLSFFGEISFSLYLYHQAVLALSRNTRWWEPSWITELSGVALSVAIAKLSFYLIEEPATRRWSFSSVLFATVAPLMLIIVLSNSRLMFDLFPRPEGDRVIDEFSFADANSYSRDRFLSLRDNEFIGGNSALLKVLVIGDSFAQDVVNALYEADLIAKQKLDVVTFRIQQGCGIFWTDRAEAVNLSSRMKSRCEERQTLDNSLLLDRISASDIILVVGAWRDWHVELIGDTYRYLQGLTSNPIYFATRKDFGSWDVTKLWRVPIQLRPSKTSIPQANVVEINRSLRHRLPANRVWDVQSYFCKTPSSGCRLFNDEGVWLTFDGRHLTEQGAQYFGKRLSEDEKWASMIEGARQR